MTKFIVFYQKLHNGNIDTCVGGDSEIKVDGRYSFNKIIDKVFKGEYARPKEAIGFKIHCGTNHLNHKPYTKLYQFIYKINNGI